MKETFTEEVLELDLAQPTQISTQYQDFIGFQRLGTKFWKEGNGVNGTLFRLALRSQGSEISSVVYDDRRISGLIEKFLKEAHSTMMFLKNIKSIKVFTIEAGTNHLEEKYSATLSSSSVNYFPAKLNFVQKIKQHVNNKSFASIECLDHILGIDVKRANEATTEYKYAIAERFGYDGTDRDFLELISDKDLSYIPLVAVAYPMLNNDPGGHVFCTLPLPLNKYRMTGMPVHVNGFFALGQDRKDLKWKTLSTDQSNDKTVNWNIRLITELLPYVYFNLFKFMVQQRLPADSIYQAWPARNEIDPKWEMFLQQFNALMKNCSFIFVDSRQTWFKTTDVHFINSDQMAPRQLESVKKFLTKASYSFAVVPTKITTDIGGCAWINSNTIINLLRQNSSWYKSLDLAAQCDLLSYAVQSANDLVLLVNLNLFPLTTGGYFQLQRKQYGVNNFFITTESHNANLLPNTGRVVNSYFFNGNTDFLQRFTTYIATGMFDIYFFNLDFFVRFFAIYNHIE